MFKFFLFIFLFFSNNLFCVNKDINLDKPIKIKSDEIVIKKNKNLIIFKGRVETIQDNLSTFANKMYVNYKNDLDNKIEIKNIKLYGNVVLKNDKIIVNGDKGIYNFDDNLITIEDNIIMNENNAVIFGNELIYNTLTEETNIYGENSKNKEDDKKDKRITIILDNINDLKDEYGK